MKYSFYTLGCKVNQYESQALGELLSKFGYEPAPAGESADVYIINSCTVTAESDRKTRQAVRRFKRNNPNAVVVLTGCMPQAYPEDAQSLAEADIVIGNKNNGELPELLEAYLRDKQRCVVTAQHIKDESFDICPITSFNERTRAYVKIQDGCNRFCSYCIIPVSRGRVRSKPLSALKTELQTLAAAGYKEVVLVGINLSSYGQDIGESFPSAVELACSVEGIERVRLGSLEPDHLTEEVVERLSKCKKLCPQFHISLQSGCNSTLRRMNRHYTTEEYAAGCEILRRYFDNPAITTDVIVGFPGETEEEFEETKAFLERIGFYEMHIFKYSRRAGTRADRMPDQIPEQVKSVRSEILLKLEKQMSKAYRESFLGRNKTVLLEEKTEINGREYMIGHTMEYVKAVVSYEENLKNKMAEGVLKGVLNDDVLLLDESWKVV